MQKQHLIHKNNTTHKKQHNTMQHTKKQHVTHKKTRNTPAKNNK